MTLEHWLFSHEGFEPAKEGLREALCTLGNGYFATRGAAPEATADETHYPGTYLAGGYNRLKTDLAGRVVENEDLVNMPNWLPLTFRLEGGDWFNVRAVKLLEYRQELDMARGLLLRTVRFEDKQGRRTRVEQRRFVHMRDKHLAGQELVLAPENWAGACDLRSALDGRVVNGGVPRYQQLNCKHLRCPGDGGGGRGDAAAGGGDGAIAPGGGGGGAHAAVRERPARGGGARARRGGGLPRARVHGGRARGRAPLGGEGGGAVLVEGPRGVGARAGGPARGGGGARALRGAGGHARAGVDAPVAPV